MFKVIEPHQQHHFKQLLNLFLKPIKSQKILRSSFTQKEQATFILMQNKERGIHGGAILMKNKISTLHKLCKEILASSNSEVWTCTAYLHFENDIFFDCFEAFCIYFYKDLYKQIKEFGEKEGIKYLYVKLFPEEYFCTEVLGAWQFVYEIRPGESKDGLFHGVLTINDA